VNIGRNRIVTALSLIVLFSSAASAHYTFVMPEKFRVSQGETVKIGFHSADGFPDSSAIGKRFQETALYTSSGRTEITGLVEEGKRLVANITVPASGHIVATVVNASAMENMKAESFTKYLKEEGLTSIVDDRAKAGESDKPARERYTMYAKSIMLAGAPNNDYKRIVGTPIEIVPEMDPYAMKAGQLLPVRVLFKGTAAKNLEMMATSTAMTPVKAKSIGRTDADGRINVPVTSGMWRLHTILMERSSQPDTDWESHWATLTFEVR
jgi:uncharacterized GH25 family protein